MSNHCSFHLCYQYIFNHYSPNWNDLCRWLKSYLLRYDIFTMFIKLCWFRKLHFLPQKVAISGKNRQNWFFSIYFGLNINIRISFKKYLCNMSWKRGKISWHFSAHRIFSIMIIYGQLHIAGGNNNKNNKKNEINVHRIHSVWLFAVCWEMAWMMLMVMIIISFIHAYK